MSKSKDAFHKDPFTICFVGPSHCGKTSLINRLISNSFYAEYMPTTSINKYRLVYAASSSGPVAPGAHIQDVQFIEVELYDTFPLDHPELHRPDLSKGGDSVPQSASAYMKAQLRDIINNEYFKNKDVPQQQAVQQSKKDNSKNASQQSTNKQQSKQQLDNLSSKKFHCYIFVYDASDRDSYIEMLKLHDAIEAKEKSEQRGHGEDPDKANKFLRTSKWVLGNKLDLRQKKRVLEEEDKKRVVDTHHFGVSAMTNYRVQELFHNIVMELQNDPILKKEHDEAYKEFTDKQFQEKAIKPKQGNWSKDFRW